ncbi:hypothetical protein CHY_2352 [Carboxydothermus hydrogenoformans Z-2901]|uniref:Uncharacterized protein n=1 Tax=Carboxydothermus hydrogenoformans (strain ATCC BAA-161 / DSM 6008 / Z-2901) TaxID=246194 RepID=Q3A9M7_CARHZ|nr:hypothetical protein CHY_2352 [Carboxydothermus hydrogenoformans Z-2901]
MTRAFKLFFQKNKAFIPAEIKASIHPTFPCHN